MPPESEPNFQDPQDILKTSSDTARASRAHRQQGKAIQEGKSGQHGGSMIPAERVYEALYSTGVCTLICACTHIIASRVWVRMLGPKRVAALSERERLYLGEKTVATLNGIISGGLAAYAVGSGSWRGDVVHPYPRTAHYALSLFSGFSIYDSVVMALSVREPPMMWIHHVFGVLGAFLMMCCRKLAFFPLAFTITELTTVPFNIIWYTRAFGVPRASRLVRSLLFIRALAFLIIRAPIGFTSIAYAHMHTKGGIIRLWKRLFMRGEVKPAFLPYGTAMNTTLFSALNLIWTIQALQAHLKGNKLN